MAERRMFAKTIIDSDAFLDMPQSSQLLYFHLSMRADDDGFINKPKSIMRIIGCKDDDIKLLITKKFIIPFESGVVVIKHWKIHNYIQKDRYQPTKYGDLKDLLSLDSNNSYTISEGVKLDSPKEKNTLSDARQKKLDAMKESDLPYSFTYKIRNAFIGEICPICGVKMGVSVREEGDPTVTSTPYPTIQHNTPISKGGKHELGNISVVCAKCNASIQDNETTRLNADLVIEKWRKINGDIGNVSGMDTQVRLGKDSLDKERIVEYSIVDDSPASPPNPTRHKYGMYNNVLLSDEDMQKLRDEFPHDYTDRIERLSEYIASTGKKYKSHLATIRSWARKDKQHEKEKSSNPFLDMLEEEKI